MIYSYNGKTPKIADSAFIADYVTITGDVAIGEESSIWFQTTIRGDVSTTVIGNRVNVQDNSVLHQSSNSSLTIEDNVTIGHQCIIHGCTIRKGALIGMGSTILDNAEIGEGAFVGAGSLVPPGKKIPPNTLVVGRPAKVVRELTEEDRKYLTNINDDYVKKGKEYKLLQSQEKSK